MDYTKKTIVVTGAAKGIGAACAKLFYEAGANVVLLDLAMEQVPPDHQRWLFIQCNVAIESEVAAAFEHGRIDCTGANSHTADVR